MTQGWICPRCRASNAPSVQRCSCVDASPFLPLNPVVPSPTAFPNPPWPTTITICSCPPGTSCMNSACPHRPQITCGSLAPLTASMS